MTNITIIDFFQELKEPQTINMKLYEDDVKAYIETITNKNDRDTVKIWEIIYILEKYYKIINDSLTAFFHMEMNKLKKTHNILIDEDYEFIRNKYLNKENQYIEHRRNDDAKVLTSKQFVNDMILISEKCANNFKYMIQDIVTSINTYYEKYPDANIVASIDKSHHDLMVEYDKHVNIIKQTYNKEYSEKINRRLYYITLLSQQKYSEASKYYD